MKQVIVFRADLKLSKGKFAVQVAHAAVSASDLSKEYKNWYISWLAQGQKKVVVKVPTLQELIALHTAAKSINLPCYLVKDAGRTEIPAGTITCLGIGPAPEKLIDKITGNLSLG